MTKGQGSNGLSPEPKATALPPASPSIPGAESGPKSFRTRAVLIAALVIAGLWISGLGVLALVSANPVTLNQKQIRESHLIVTAVRESDDSTALAVTKEWIRGEELGRITVGNLGETRMRAGQDFLVPLQRLSTGRYQVTATSLPNEAPLVYPATPEAESQLQRLLDSREE